MLYLGLAERARLYELLHRIDLGLAAEVRSAGCPHCGRPLCRAAYPRQTGGGPADLPEALKVRESLCCSREGCRRRTLPPSTLFLGRRVYWTGVILLVVTLRQRRAAGTSLKGLQQRFGVSPSTVARWMTWFAEEFPTTPLWKRIRGQVSPTVRDDQLPDSLVRLFESSAPDPESALVSCSMLLAS
jgi:hypothetical protein